MRAMSETQLTIDAYTDPMFGENAYLVTVPGAGQGPVGWILDPGFPPAVDELIAAARRRGVQVEKIILTHGHADHIVGLDAVAEAFPEAEVWMAAEEQPLLTDAELNLSAPFGFSVTCRTKATHDLAPGAVLTLGGTSWRVLDTAGHSPAGRSLHSDDCGVVFSGDALFAGSIGRTDFPGSDHQRLIRLIRENLLTLPDATVVHSGHGGQTTIGTERKSNPYVADIT